MKIQMLQPDLLIFMFIIQNINMKTFWMIVSFYSFGVITGIFLWEKIDFKTIYKGQIKLKQRGSGNTQNSQVTLKMDRKAKREAAKQARIVERNTKKAKKAADKLEKTL